ncbi:MAG TPA: DUF4382 domain-containing protein [Steroidobacteraceae bacterium]|nr:DUF4382 domain-containing protein [Steroidobacteraceae bacterium]
MRRILALAAFALLAACDAAVEVNATGNVAAGYSSVLVTVEEVWFNESATAAPADDTWEKFRLDDARTIDLVDVTGGGLTSIASDLVLPSGRWRQMRLLLADSDAKLHDSAKELDARHNNEVRWFNDNGDERTTRLEVLNAGEGIGVGLALKVVVDTGGSTPINTVQVAFDAARDLTEFHFGGRTGFVLNPVLRAYEVGDAGTIRGTLNLSQLDIDTDTGRPDIQVTAQELDRALGRHVLVGSSSVGVNGAFVLYPLPLGDDEQSPQFDLVISGPGIQTVVVRDVPVSTGTPANAANVSLGITLEPADPYEANLQAEAPLVPRGARVGFYQTLPGEDEPYLIAVAPVDPLSGRFARPVALSRADSISYGTYGAGFTLRSGTPREGAARYGVAAVSSQYGHGAFASTTLRPASPASDTALFSVPPLDVVAPAVPGSISATVTVENPAQYDRGALLVTREGAVVTVVPLDEVLQQQLGSTFVDVTQVPAGTDITNLAAGLYHLEAWTWHSADAAGTFSRHSGDAAVDLRATASASAAVTIR